MMERHRRFTAWQRVLHWLMAACILAMLFIGVGMVSTVTPIYLTDPQTARHRHSGARADPLGAPPALWCAVAAGPTCLSR
jgi:hypothetical protein